MKPGVHGSFTLIRLNKMRRAEGLPPLVVASLPTSTHPKQLRSKAKAKIKRARIVASEKALERARGAL